MESAEPPVDPVQQGEPQAPPPDTNPEPFVPPLHWERYQDTEGGWRFRLRSANGEIVLPPESVTRSEDVPRQIEQLVATIGQAGTFGGEDEAGEPMVYVAKIEDTGE